jgi:AraC family transcriptional regulator, regulatory protein of adaptative response / methylated-DNA-[protein]-cysteine methyltransferase
MTISMINQSQIDYKRVERAIEYIVHNYKDKPSLEEIAAEIHVSPFHFQRLFSKWAGVSPKKFIQFLSLDYAKNILRAPGASVLDAAYDAGFSGAGRLHDLFMTIEGMTPGAFKQQGAGLDINYNFADSPFSTVMVASTANGICHMAFEDDQDSGFETLYRIFPQAQFHQCRDSIQQAALSVFDTDGAQPDGKITLHLQGTPFQIKVWEALLKVPMGALASYGDVARMIGQPGASRAVGNAIGHNPVAFLIPCHRVIRQNGAIGGYMWGAKRKQAMIAWEGAQMMD